MALRSATWCLAARAAMGNGEQCVKDAADWVADAVDASGLARAFERLGVV